jgi:hypothetical protein
MWCWCSAVSNISVQGSDSPLYDVQGNNIFNFTPALHFIIMVMKGCQQHHCRSSGNPCAAAQDKVCEHDV